MTLPATPVSRRAALAFLVALGTLLPAAAIAQQPPRAPRIGMIGERSASDPFLAAFRRGMSKLGYVDGRNITIEYRYAQGVLDQVPRLAAELIDLTKQVRRPIRRAAARSPLWAATRATSEGSRPRKST